MRVDQQNATPIARMPLRHAHKFVQCDEVKDVTHDQIWGCIQPDNITECRCLYLRLNFRSTSGNIAFIQISHYQSSPLPYIGTGGIPIY